MLSAPRDMRSRTEPIPSRSQGERLAASGGHKGPDTALRRRGADSHHGGKHSNTGRRTRQSQSSRAGPRRVHTGRQCADIRHTKSRTGSAVPSLSPLTFRPREARAWP